MPHTPEPWEVEKDDEIFGRYRIVGMNFLEMNRIDEGYDISDEEGDRRDREARERDEGNRLLIQAAPKLLGLVQEAFERFTDNDMQPPNHRLSTWLKRAAEILSQIKGG